ncbi:hypothetical protein Tco_0822306 [Tanacetum coccineum]|uniref:Transposase (putative) gypsy type domain-containing protein n=1 Tax=Tanacetum coccineum TaxID=301880 RepID=A0ABQ5AHT5_9ASTR
MANKHSIMTREMVESFCDSYYIPDEVHPTAPGRDRTITQFPEGKVGVYTRLFDYCGYRIPLTKFFVSVLKYFRIHISQLSPFGAARISHFEVLTRVLDLGPSVSVFRAFYTRMYSDGLFSFAKRSLSAPSCLSKPPDSIKNWADHFFWVDSRVFPISVPLYTGGVLEKDPAPHLTARQEQAVQILSSNKAPFRWYPECFLALVGLSPYYPFGENTYPAFEGPDRTDMGLLDYIRTADPRKVQTVEVQKGEEQVTLFDSIKHCFVSLDAPAAAHQASGSGSGAGAEVSAPSVEGNVVGENVIPESAFLNPTDPDCDVTVAEKDVAQRQPEKAKRKKLLKRSDPLPAKRLRTDHPSLASGTGGKSLASLRQSLPEGSLTLETSSPADIPTHVTVPRYIRARHFSLIFPVPVLKTLFFFASSCAADAPVYTAADIVTSSRGKTLVLPTSGVGGSSQPETSEESTDSFYETAVLNSEDAKRWYIPRWNITNDSLLDDGFSCRTLVDRVAPPGFFSTLRNMDYDQLFTEFNVGAARQICLGSEVRSRAEHELELKEKLRAKYDARGVLLSEKDAEIARLKSLLKEKETEAAEVLRLRDQVSVLAAEKSSLSAEVSALKSDVSQKDTVISLLDSRASHLKSSLDDSQAACDEAKNLISSLSSEKDGLVSEVSILRSSFRDFKDKMEAQQEEQAQELYNRVAELEAHVMDVSGRLEGEFYPAYLTALAGRRWLLTHGMELAMVKCLKSPEYQGILGHALGRAVDYGMQEGLVAGHEHGIAGTPLSAVMAYDPETTKNNYFDAVRALEEADFPLIHLLKSKKDSGMGEVLDCFLLDGPLANLPEAAYLQPCLEQLSVPIYYADVNAVVGETSLSFALLNVHNRAEGARKHAAALRRLMVDIVSHPLSSQNLLGEASTSAVAFFDDLDTDEDLGSVVCMPHLEDPRFEILP